MHDQMQDGMAEATRLTREGRLPKRPPLFSVPSGALSSQGRQRTTTVLMSRSRRTST
jgi:hypothetical protein